MHQLTLFAPTEPTPAPAKKSFKAKPTPTKESGLEVDSSIATKSPEPTQAEAQRLIQISLNQSPTVPAKPLPSSDLSGEEWVKEYYRMPEPINPGDRVRTPAGKEGIVTRWQLDENNLPNGLPRVDWSSPDVMPGLREAYVRTDGSDEDEGFYAYHLTKIKYGNSHNSITPTVSGDKLSQELTQEEIDPLFILLQTSYEFSEKEIAWWKDREIEVCIEWLALDNSIAMVRDLATKKPYNVPISELQPVLAKRELGDFNSAKKPDSGAAVDVTQSNAGTDANTAIISENLSHSSGKSKCGKSTNSDTASDTNFLKTNQENTATTKPLILPTGKELKPETKEATTSKTGKILTFTITTKRSAEMGVADPLLTGKKTCTRRLVTGWTASTVSWYQRAFEEGLNIQAWTAIPIAPESRKLADIRLTKAIYQEALKDMPDEDLEAEGGLWSTKDEFIETVCKGKPDPSLKAWVVRFEVVNICV